jgi:hypothetical protein
MITSTITWRPLDEVWPDADITVLIALDEGTVTEAWLDGERWQLGDRLSFPAHPEADEKVPRVMAWADIPAHPFEDDLPVRGIPYTVGAEEVPS